MDSASGTPCSRRLRTCASVRVRLAGQSDAIPHVDAVVVDGDVEIARLDHLAERDVDGGLRIQGPGPQRNGSRMGRGQGGVVHQVALVVVGGGHVDQVGLSHRRDAEAAADRGLDRKALSVEPGPAGSSRPGCRVSDAGPRQDKCRTQIIASRPTQLIMVTTQLILNDTRIPLSDHFPPVVIIIGCILASFADGYQLASSVIMIIDSQCSIAIRGGNQTNDVNRSQVHL